MNETTPPTRYTYTRGPFVDVFDVDPSYADYIAEMDDEKRQETLDMAARGMGCAWWVTHTQINPDGTEVRRDHHCNACR